MIPGSTSINRAGTQTGKPSRKKKGGKGGRSKETRWLGREHEETRGEKRGGGGISVKGGRKGGGPKEGKKDQKTLAI